MPGVTVSLTLEKTQETQETQTWAYQGGLRVTDRHKPATAESA